jgi:hypothetical protein
MKKNIGMTDKIIRGILLLLLIVFSQYNYWHTALSFR